MLADCIEQPDVTVVAALACLTQLYEIDSQSFERSGGWFSRRPSALELVKLRLNACRAILLRWCLSAFLNFDTVDTLLKLCDDLRARMAPNLMCFLGC
jgi:hypothetical protein